MEQRLLNQTGSYAREYIRRFNELYQQLRNLADPASLYARPVVSATIFRAQDGIALFYLPEDPHRDRPVVRFITHDKMPLSQLIQSVTVNNVKVLLPPTEPIKSDLSNQSQLFQFPPDLPIETLKQAEYHTLNPELVDAILRHGTLSIIGMAIAPALRIQGGLATGSLPTRNHLFSPAIALPDGRLVLQYQWLFADILWYPGDLVIDEETARRFAEADIQVLRLGIEAGYPQQDFYGNPFETVSRQLLLVCQSFEKLLNNPHTVESHVQAFLENPAHYFLIAPAHQEILPRKTLGGGKYITDFTVLRADGEYHFIEIENPQKEIYQPSRQEQSAHLTHAIGQVQDWLRYVNDNRDSVRREDGLSTIYEPTGEVIAGRDAHLGDTAALRFRFLRSETSHIKLRTYDMLLEDARAYARTLHSLGSSPQNLGR